MARLQKRIVTSQRNSIKTLPMHGQIWLARYKTNLKLPVEKNMEYRDLSFEEFEKAFKSVKRNKAAGHDGFDSNVIIRVYDGVSYPLFLIFHSSFNEFIFPEIDQYRFFPYSPKY